MTVVRPLLKELITYLIMKDSFSLIILITLFQLKDTHYPLREISLLFVGKKNR